MRVFKECAPTAHMVVLPNAHHYVFLSNETDVLPEMREFVKNVP